MNIDREQFTANTVTIGSESVSFYARVNVPYVRIPADKEYQSLNIFVPEAYFADGSVNGYTAQASV